MGGGLWGVFLGGWRYFGQVVDGLLEGGHDDLVQHGHGLVARLQVGRQLGVGVRGCGVQWGVRETDPSPI